jgi:threonine dehydratase
VTSDDEEQLAALPERLAAGGYAWEDMSGAVDVAFRAIPLHGELLTFPLFLRLDFYERRGALHDFLDKIIRGRASFCYFNYRQSGERIGRALIGLEFATADEREAFARTLAPHGDGYRFCAPVDEATQRRILGS